MYKNFFFSASAFFIMTLLLLTETVDAADPYAIISEKNLFRPDRKEWVIEEQDSKIVDKKIDPNELELYGTIIIGDKKSALIHDKKSKSKGRGKAKENNKQAEIYSLGDYVGGYVVSAIGEKRVVLDYYGEKVTLYLHEGKESPKGDVTPLSEEKPKLKKIKQRAEKKEKKDKMHDMLTSGKIPEALANSPFMSEENMKKILDFNKEIMEELKESGGTLDQEAIKEKVGKFRERFMEEIGDMEQ